MSYVPTREGKVLKLQNTWALQQLGQNYPELRTALAHLTWPDSLAIPLDRPYARHCLLEWQGHELLLLAWRPSAPTAIHDHGGGHGSAFVLQGTLEEKSWASKEALWRMEAPRQRRLTSSQKHSLGIEKEHLHCMESMAETTYSLHHYQGISAPMHIYDPQKRRSLVLAQDHGAWMPCPNEPWKEIPWPPL